MSLRELAINNPNSIDGAALNASSSRKRRRSSGLDGRLCPGCHQRCPPGAFTKIGRHGQVTEKDGELQVWERKWHEWNLSYLDRKCLDCREEIAAQRAASRTAAIAANNVEAVTTNDSRKQQNSLDYCEVSVATRADSESVATDDASSSRRRQRRRSSGLDGRLCLGCHQRCPPAAFTRVGRHGRDRRPASCKYIRREIEPLITDDTRERPGTDLDEAEWTARLFRQKIGN
ncbi:hypothetical protein V8E54_014167 [Elaphomyces granulatus]